jgi:hypothetical protein
MGLNGARAPTTALRLFSFFLFSSLLFSSLLYLTGIPAQKGQHDGEGIMMRPPDAHPGSFLFCGETGLLFSPFLFMFLSFLISSLPLFPFFFSFFPLPKLESSFQTFSLLLEIFPFSSISHFCFVSPFPPLLCPSILILLPLHPSLTNHRSSFCSRSSSSFLPLQSLLCSLI